MKIKLDENLPLRLADALRELGHEVHTLFDERLAGQADANIWEATQKEARFRIYAGSRFLGPAKVCAWVTPGNSAGTATFAKPQRLGGTDRGIVSEGKCR